MNESALEALFEGLEKAGTDGQRQEIFDRIAEVVAAHVGDLFDGGAPEAPGEDLQATWEELVQAGGPQHDTREDDAGRGGDRQPRQALVP